MFVRSAVRVFTDRQTDRHTDDVKTITPVADAGCNDSDKTHSIKYPTHIIVLISA